MKLCKYTFTLCLSLVVSYMLLPSISYAAETNPFSDEAFTPDKVEDTAQIKNKVNELKQRRTIAEKAADAAEEAVKNAGGGRSLRRHARKQAEGEENKLNEELNGASDALRKATTNYIQKYSELVSIDNQISNYENASKAKGEIYSMPVGDGDDVIYFEKKLDGSYVALGGTSEGCTPLPAKLAESRQCLFCPLFTVLYNAANAMSTKSFTGLAGPITYALIVGFGIFIAFKVMFLVSGFTKQDGPKFISELLTQTFKVFVAIVILTNASHVYDWIISPVLEAGLEFGSSFLFAQGKKNMELCMGTMGGASMIGDIEISDGVLSRNLYLKLHCFVLSVQVEIAMPQAIGSSLMCISTNAAAGNFIVKNIIPDFSMLIQGLVIWAFSFLVSLAFAFYLIDATVRIGIVGALMPFLVATWPFKITSKYANTGFTMLMNSFFVYTFVGIVISINIELMGNALGGPDGFEGIAEKINGNNVKELQNLLDIGMGGFLILIGCCLFGFKLTNQSTDLANNLAGGGGGEGIGNKIGGLAASAVKGGVKAGVGGAGKLAKATGASDAINKRIGNAGAAIGKKIGMGRYGGAAGGKKGAAGKAGKGVETAGKATKAAGKGVEATGKGVEAAGKGVEAGGRAAGQGISSAGQALSATGVGAIVGAPMMVAGQATSAASTAAGKGMQASGQAMQQTGKGMQAAGDGMQTAGKGMQAADQAAQGAKEATQNRNDENKDGNK